MIKCQEIGQFGTIVLWWIAAPCLANFLQENRERLESRGVEVKTENKAYESGIYGFVRSEAEGGPAVNAGETLRQ